MSKYQLFRWIAGAWMGCLFLVSEEVTAQSFLYADVDNYLDIHVPGIPYSLLHISTTGGTIERGERTILVPTQKDRMGNMQFKKEIVKCWIARPEWVPGENGERPEFKVSVGIQVRDSVKVFATKTYNLKTVLYIDVTKESHILTEEDVMKEDVILINNTMGNTFNLIFYVPNGQSVTPPKDHPKAHLFDAEKKVLRNMKSKGKMYIKFPGFNNTIELIRE